MMICCVAASSCWYDVTLGTLDFADQCMQMKLASADDIKANKAKVDEMDSLITGIAEVSAQVTVRSLLLPLSLSLCLCAACVTVATTLTSSHSRALSLSLYRHIWKET